MGREGLGDFSRITMLEGGSLLHLSVVQHRRPYESGRRQGIMQSVTLIRSRRRGQAGTALRGRMRLAGAHCYLSSGGPVPPLKRFAR